MSKTEIVTMAQGWLMGLGDQAFLDAGYEGEISELAQRTGMFVEDTILHIEQGRADYLLDARAITPRSMALYPDGELESETVEALDQHDPNWRTQEGPPTHYTQDLHEPRTVRLFPIPEDDGTPGMWMGGFPSPEGELYAVYTAIPQVEDVPEWLDGRLSLSLAATEAQREGETQDMNLGQALTQLASLYDQLLMDAEEF